MPTYIIIIFTHYHSSSSVIHRLLHIICHQILNITLFLQYSGPEDLLINVHEIVIEEKWGTVASVVVHHQD